VKSKTSWREKLEKPQQPKLVPIPPRQFEVKVGGELGWLYREAVMKLSPGLPRFAATLGNGSNDNNPNGVVSVSQPGGRHSIQRCRLMFRFAQEAQPRWGCAPFDNSISV